MSSAVSIPGEKTAGTRPNILLEGIHRKCAVAEPKSSTLNRSRHFCLSMCFPSCSQSSTSAYNLASIMKPRSAGCLARERTQRVYIANDASSFKAFGCTFGKGTGAQRGRRRVLWAIGVAIPVYMNSGRLKKANMSTENAPGRKKQNLNIW